MSEQRPNPRAPRSEPPVAGTSAQAQAAAATGQERQPPGIDRPIGTQQPRAGVAGVQPRFAPAPPNPSDMAYHWYMPWGIPGDVNRVRPWSILPKAIDPATSPIYFGRAIVVDQTTQRARLVQAGDDPEDVWGISVRPYPFQSTFGSYGPGYGDYGSVGFGTGVQPMHAPLDVLEWGYIFVQIFGDPPGQTLGGQRPVHVWTGPDETNASGQLIHAQGGFETAGGIELPGWTTRFNGQRGNVSELRFNI